MSRCTVRRTQGIKSAGHETSGEIGHQVSYLKRQRLRQVHINSRRPETQPFRPTFHHAKDPFRLFSTPMRYSSLSFYKASFSSNTRKACAQAWSELSDVRRTSVAVPDINKMPHDDEIGNTLRQWRVERRNEPMPNLTSLGPVITSAAKT